MGAELVLLDDSLATVGKACGKAHRRDIVVLAQDLFLEARDDVQNIQHNAIRAVARLYRVVNFSCHACKVEEHQFGGDVVRGHFRVLKLVCGEGTDVWMLIFTRKLPGQISPDPSPAPISDMRVLAL